MDGNYTNYEPSKNGLNTIYMHNPNVSGIENIIVTSGDLTTRWRTRTGWHSSVHALRDALKKGNQFHCVHNQNSTPWFGIGVDSSPLTPDQANQFTKGQWIPLLSIPRYLKVCPSDPIITDPYIKTTNTLDEKWSKILATEKKPIVGINWQGNPNTEKTGLAGRSLALKAFALIAKNSQISLLSLQKGFGSEADTCSFKKRFVGCQDHISKTWDFLETAAIIANCDLIITSDTSIAHLAGGMGKPTWLLLHKVPDWRWGLTGHTSFWYPSMRLFRQQKRGNWKEVIEK